MLLRYLLIAAKNTAIEVDQVQCLWQPDDIHSAEEVVSITSWPSIFRTVTFVPSPNLLIKSYTIIII